MDFSKLTIRSISLALMLAVPGQAALLCDQTTTSRCDKIDTNNNLLIASGQSTRVSYIASLSGLTAATAHQLSIESSAGTGFKLAWWCIGLSNATAASTIAVVVNRRSTVSTGGTALTAEGTGATAISKMDPAAASFGGIARSDGTLGTIGPSTDQVNLEIGIIATGAGSERPFCQFYGQGGMQMPAVAAGVANGISISVPTLGAGSLATSISAGIIVE